MRSGEVNVGDGQASSGSNAGSWVSAAPKEEVGVDTDDDVAAAAAAAAVGDEDGERVDP